MTPNPSDRPELKTLLEFIKGIRVAMFSTIATDGRLHSRPMYTYPPDENQPELLWFTTDTQSAKVHELDRNPLVHLTYADVNGNNYVALSGIGSMVDDRERLRKMWNIHTKAWFPGGPDDPNLGLLRVQIQHAEYWDGPSKPAYAISLLKAVVTGGQPAGGEHRVVR